MNAERIRKAVFRPLRSGPLELRNRLVMAPMTRAKATRGVLPEESIGYYRRRAESGVGLIISEGTWIDHPEASDRQAVPCFYGDEALARWKQVIGAVHAAGGKMFPQLWHIGGVADRSQGFNPQLPSVGPSGIISTAGVAGTSSRALEASEIDSVIDAYARAAAKAQQLGFDGIELHGGHGFLIDQFLWPATNRRGDGYNGSIKDRARFAVEIVSECKARTHKEFPVSFRFSQWKIGDYGARIFENQGDLACFVEAMADAGVDLFSCSTRKHWEPAFSGSDLTLAGWTKKLSGKPTIAVGGVGVNEENLTCTETAEGAELAMASIEQAVERLETDEYDLIAVGRSILADHLWPKKVRNGEWRDIVPFREEIRHVMY